jgi:hypothetical protein
MSYQPSVAHPQAQRFYWGIHLGSASSRGVLMEDLHHRVVFSVERLSKN